MTWRLPVASTQSTRGVAIDGPPGLAHAIDGRRNRWSRCALTAARPRRREVEALEASLGDKVMALDGRVGALQATSLADAEKTYAKGATAAEVNAELCELQTYARGEAAACVLT